MSLAFAWQSDERTALHGFLKFYRDVMLRKITGLDEEQARFRPSPKSNSLLGLLNHLAVVEDNWLQWAVSGSPIQRDRDAEFSPPDSLTVEQAITNYHAACARSDAVIDEVSLDDMCRGEWASERSVRWVMIHMLEETARHAGHADITRELIDGSTGH